MPRHAPFHRFLLGGLVLALAHTGLFAAEPLVEPWLTVAFNEGPVSDGRDGVYFSDISNNRIVYLDGQGAARVYRQPSNYSNGLVIDSRNRLLAVELGDPATGTPPRVTRTDLATGAVEVLVDQVEGRRLRGPNDITLDGQGRIYFSDTRRANLLKPWAPGETDRSNPASVYRIDASGGVFRVAAEPDLADPNGLMLSPDDRTLYVTDQSGVVLAFDLGADGRATNRRVFHEFSPGRGGDGLAINTEGNLYVAAGVNHPRGSQSRVYAAGIYVFAPDRRLLRFIPVPEDPVSNVAFGGEDNRTLIITAGKSVFRVLNPTPGLRR